jgi:hypothetical protein
MLFALQHNKRDKVLDNPRGRFMASLKDSARILIKSKMPTNEYAAFNLCFSSDFWKKYLADKSDRHHMTTGNHSAVNKIVTVVAEALANHIGSRPDLILLFSRNNFKGAAVFLKAALIHDQNMVPGATQLDPSLVSTERMVDTYISPAIVAPFKKVPALEWFYEDFTSDGWLGTEATKLLHEVGTQCEHGRRSRRAAPGPFSSRRCETSPGGPWQFASWSSCSCAYIWRASGSQRRSSN